MAQPNASHDYVAEIEAPAESVAGALVRKLTSAGYTVSRAEEDKEDSLLASNRRPSLGKHIITAKPDQMHWCVTALSAGTCRVTVDNSLSRRTTWRLYGFLTLVGLMTQICAWLLDSYPSSSEVKLTVARLGGVNIIMFGFFGMGAVLLVTFLALGALQTKYRLWGQSFLNEVLLRVQPEDPPLAGESHLLMHKRLIDMKAMIYAASFLLMPGVIFHPEWFWPILSNHVEIPLLGLAMIASLALPRIKKANPYLTGKVSPVVVHILLACCIVIPLFVFPLEAFRICRHNVGVAERCQVAGYCFEDSQAQVNGRFLPVETELPQIWSAMRRQGLLLLIIYGMFGLMVMALLFYCGGVLEYYRKGRNSLHQQAMQDAFELHHYTHSGWQTNMGLPIAMKICLGGLFLILSFLCWSGVLFVLSLINALVAPESPVFHAPVGRIIAQGTAVLASVGLGPFESPGQKQFLRLLFLMPLLAGPVLLGLLHLRYFWSSLRQSRRVVPLTGPIAKSVHTVAGEMGVNNVRCLLDPERKAISPHVAYHGLLPNKQIIFTPRSVDFMEKFPEQAVAIIAHEIAHLKSDFLSLWIMPFLSRLGLVGAGFLSMLQNSLSMEDRADRHARAYLTARGMKEELVGEAAKLVAYLGYQGEDDTLNMPSGATRDCADENVDHKVRVSFLSKAVARLDLAYQLYFRTHMYDYLHHNAWHRIEMRRQNSESHDHGREKGSLISVFK